VLIIERRRGERIRIGDNIVVTVTEVGKDAERWIKVGIEAPRHMPIVRPNAVSKTPKIREGKPHEAR